MKNGLHFNVIGATGLVGKEFVRYLLTNPTAAPHVAKVTVFTRRPLEFPDAEFGSKLTTETVDFERLNHPTEGWRSLLQGDVLFSALGTTLKQAKTKEEQYKVDYHHQMEVARAFRTNGGKAMTLISAAGADAKSPFFYVRMKGELERDLQKLEFESLRILRPALLKGNRTESRLGETMSDAILSSLGHLLPRGLPLSIKPIPATTVAQAAFFACLKSHRGTLIFGPQDLWQLASSHLENEK